MFAMLNLCCLVVFTFGNDVCYFKTISNNRYIKNKKNFINYHNFTKACL